MFDAVRIAFAALLLMAGAAWAERPVTVFAAASLADVLHKIAADWTGGEVVISAAGSPVLARQIQQGAPADIFVSANGAWMDVLERDGLIVQGSRVDLAGNGLVLVGHGAVAPFDPVALPERLGEERLAVALVEAVPAGIYAAQALRATGIWGALEPRLAQTDNVRAALALVARGEVPFGIVYASDAAAEPAVTVVARFADGTHDPVVYPAALIAPVFAPAEAFLAYLQSRKAQAIFAEYGFAPLQ